MYVYAKDDTENMYHAITMVLRQTCGAWLFFRLASYVGTSYELRVRWQWYIASMSGIK